MLPEETNEPLEGATTLNIPEPEASNDNGADDEPGARAGETPAQTEERRLTRKERKDNRFNDARKAAADAEKRLASYEEERRTHARELAEMRGQLTAFQQQRQLDARQQRQDPATDKVKEAQARAMAKLQAAAASTNPAASAAAMEEYHSAMTEAAELAAERRMQVQLDQFRRSMPDPQSQGMATTLASEFDWLPSNVPARQLADGYVAMLVSKGRQPGLGTYREACAMAARDFGLGGAGERPSDARRAAFAGVRGQTSGDDAPTKLSIPNADMGPLKKMAIARYPELEPDAAMGKWLKVHGNRLK